MADGVIRLVDDERIIAQAVLLAVSLQRKDPDFVYLALAERQGASIATADGCLARLARSRGVGVFLVRAERGAHRQAQSRPTDSSPAPRAS